jgi:hypothetical protein
MAGAWWLMIRKIGLLWKKRANPKNIRVLKLLFNNLRLTKTRPLSVKVSSVYADIK